MTIDTAGLHAIANNHAERMADIVFVHGILGTSHATWRHGNLGSAEHFFWPDQLGNDLKNCGIWAMGYPAALSAFSPQGMSLEKRAGNLAHKLANAGIGDRPLIFITHSMGGLVVKHLIVDSILDPDEDRRRIVGNIRGIVFCGTPHRGSSFANAAEKLLRFLGGAQEHLFEMVSHREDLDFLHDKFIQWQSKTKTGVLSYAESRSLFSDRVLGRVVEIGVVVDRISANPNIAGSSVKDLDADHISLVKPMSASDDIYAGTLRFIRDRLHSQSSSQMPLPSDEAAEARERVTSSKATPIPDTFLNQLPLEHRRAFCRNANAFTEPDCIPLRCPVKRVSTFFFDCAQRSYVKVQLIELSDHPECSVILWNVNAGSTGELDLESKIYLWSPKSGLNNAGSVLDKFNELQLSGETKVIAVVTGYGDALCGAALGRVGRDWLAVETAMFTSGTKPIEFIFGVAIEGDTIDFVSAMDFPPPLGHPIEKVDPGSLDGVIWEKLSLVSAVAARDFQKRFGSKTLAHLSSPNPERFDWKMDFRRNQIRHVSYIVETPRPRSSRRKK